MRPVGSMTKRLRACWAAELPSAPAVAEGVTACSNRALYPHGPLWKCPAWGRPVNVALNLEGGEAGAPGRLEISRAIATDHACAGAARFPQSHSAHRRSLTRKTKDLS